MVIGFNKEECEKFFDLKYKEGDIIEIRAIDLTQVEPPKKSQPPIIKYVRSKKEYIETCENINANGLFQVYSGNNPRHKEGGDALSVKSISHIVLDCDPIRPEEFEKKAATQEEMDICEKEVDRIIEHSLKIKLSRPTKIFTGNGFALDWKIPTIEITDDNREEVTNKIKNFVKEMQKNYNCETTIKIDQTGDLPRIYKPAGVMSKKGDDTKDRPFRMAKFCGDISEVEDKILFDYIMKLSPVFENITEIVDKETSGEKTESRSEQEMSEVCKIIGQGKTKEQVYKHMNAFAKWTTAPEAYRTMTYNKAVKYIESQKDKEDNIGPTHKTGLNQIELPRTGRLHSAYAKELTDNIKDKNLLFFRPSSREVIEINKIKDVKNNKEYTGFISVEPSRFITLIENHMTPGVFVYDPKRKDWDFNIKSMSNSISLTTLKSPMLQEGLPLIERIFQVPIPIMHEGILTFPKRGYDERFNSWMPFLAPEITQPEMDIEKAKLIIDNIFEDFCFKDNQDKVNAIAGLLTPFLKGLYPTFNTRMPGINYSGNRERVGKDYLAGITGITYEGEALEEPPISNNEKGGNDNSELRKKFMAALIQGRKRFHSSNNKGYIDNAVLESFLTLMAFSDRILGRNEIFSFDNEIDFSMSSNQGTTMTPDLVNRCITVNLFFDKEDANARVFKIPNLHQYIKKNRDIVLSALYSLVRNWIDNGSPNGSKPFASYPDWARICGGILEVAKIGNPCVKSGNAFLLATDTETQDMKIFFEIINEVCGDKWINRNEIKEIISNNPDNPFASFNFLDKSDQIKFGIKIDKFVGRILSDIKLTCIQDSHKNSRNKYKFAKETVTYKKRNLNLKGKVVLPVHAVHDIDSSSSNQKVVSVGSMGNMDNMDSMDKLEEPNHNITTLKNCPKCQSEDITNYPNKRIYCKKCRENYNQK